MAIEIDILNGKESWRQVEPLFASVWPPHVRAAADWGHVRWADADLRVLVETPDDGLVCHVGLYFRIATWNGKTMHVGGIGGVATHPDHRRRGYASVALDAAMQTMHAREDVQFVVLFCEPHNIAFYAARSWHPFTGDVYVEQPGGRTAFTAMAPMVHDMKRAALRSGTLDLCGLPW